VRELHHELHHTGDGDSWTASRRQKSDHDDRARLTASQAIVDTQRKNARRGRAAAANLVPTSTGAATATARALPEYRGRFDGLAIRAPVPVGSLADIVDLTARATTVDEVNRIFTEEAASDRYRGVVGVTTDLLVSSDIIRDSRASVLDLGLTHVVD
jgi:glyceraldehyde 3-phosphate dehydrogenase